VINRVLPEENVSLAGYAALMEKYELCVPLPDVLAVISSKHNKYETDGWRVFTPRHAPTSSLYGQLTFALKHEGVELAVLKALFEVVPAGEVESIVKSEPHGIYAKKIWFLYEYLQDVKLDIADATQGNFVDLLDGKFQYPGPPRPSRRHRVRNNLPGVKYFCPLVRRTPELDRLIAQDLGVRARGMIGAIHPDVLMRASAFLLLEDSKASYAIEGETPPRNRAERWGRVIGMAGQVPLSHAELERLQREVITDTRFIQMGYRKEGGFIGIRDRSTGQPIPDHISARFDDLERLMEGVIETAQLLKGSDYPPVLAAASIAFGFVFIHPFEDGNGRLQRYLLHHILQELEFTPKSVVFPVSSVILKRITEYRRVLESHSRPRLPYIEWRATEKGNVEILNDTFDLYRFFDATVQAEFFYFCVEETISKVLPEEVAYLQQYDAMKSFVSQYIDMPGPTADLLIRFLEQNTGVLSKRARGKEFSALTEAEVKVLEDKYQEVFRVRV